MKQAIWICAFVPMMAFAGCSAESDPLGVTQEALTSGLTIRRGAGTVADSTINAQEMKKNFGAKDKLIVSKKNESLLRFDVAAIPSNAIVNSATLTLYLHGREDGDDHDDDDDDRDEDCRGFSSVPIHIHRATAAWTESKVTYANFNQRFESTVAGILLPAGSNTYKSIDLKATVQAWVSGSRINHGLVLRTTSRKRWGFASSENGRGSLRPSLAIVYSTPDDHCQPNPCENGGACANGWTGYSCTCAAGYTGPNCQTNINDCAGNPCQNGGACTDGVGGYTCACAPGYSGPNCQTNIDDCAGSPCQNGGVCTDSVNSYTCVCAPGYTGTSCEININDCAGNPCQNDGVCSDGIGSYSCACASGYTGQNCEINIDDCVGSPCQNGGSCVDGVHSYTCNCAVGYEGASCETNINDCAGSPCQNGGSCVDGVGSYTCSCAPGYTGTSCEINIDDCAAHPCQNGGLCVDGVNSYTCSCTSGYTGQNCEQAGCPSGSSAFGGKCYQPFFDRPPVGSVPFNYWLWADSDCGTRFVGGRLVSIGSAAENQFVRSLSSNTGIMLGLTDAGRAANNFAWLDGLPLTYTNFAPGDPNNRTVNRFGFFLAEDWVMMNPDGTWNDLPDTDGGPYVCKFPQ